MFNSRPGALERFDLRKNTQILGILPPYSYPFAQLVQNDELTISYADFYKQKKQQKPVTQIYYL